MYRLVSATLLFSVCVLVPSLGAQAPKYLYSPAGAATQGGGANNTIPWWGQSATYQQIHDYGEMVRVAGGKVAPIVMKGLGFRPAGTNTLSGRTWDLRLAVGQCPNSAASASATFSSNLPNPTTVFGTSTTFSKFSFGGATGTGDPNPIAFTVPFNMSYVYVPVPNSHFCWEWRHLNATSYAWMTCDAIAGANARGTVLPSIGSGCSGAKSTLAIQSRNSVYNYDSQLAGAAPSATAMGMVGLVKQQTVLPGWCSNLETVPLLHVFGQTNSLGAMTFSAPLTVLKGLPQFTVYMQYAFVDTRQPFGVGLSDASVYLTNIPGGWEMTRIYKSTYNNASNGDETATSGSVGQNFGLVVGFLQ
jgi:hypothetical protein